MDHLRAYAERSDESSGPIRFVASTEGVGRDGLIINADGWQLDNYRKNPVVLWGHDYFGSRLPIGRADVEVDGQRLMANVTFDMDDEFAASIDRKYRAGYLHAVSVGWDTLDMSPANNPEMAGRVTKADLLDISAVPVPGDPNALKERQARGLLEITKALESIIDDDTQQATADADALWTGTAYQMVRLFRADADEAESTRLQAYKRLSRSYERQGKTAPEFLGATELKALDAETWRGLWLAKEIDVVPELFTRATVQPAAPETPNDDEAIVLSQLRDILNGVTNG